MVALGLLERLVFPPFIEQELAVTSAVIVYSVVAKLVVYPWQAVGVLRSCGRRIESDSGRLWATIAQVGVVVSLAVILLTTIETYQSLQIYKRNLLVEKIIPPEPQYSLELIEHGSLVHLRGPFQIGITSKLADLIERNPQIRGIILDSEGGQIYEGRGLARLIGENGLLTYTLDQCLSSCTTAFVAGAIRTLGAHARLGFHQYKTYSLIPSINIENEQAKDIAIFARQGVSAEFLDKVFIYSPEEMWWPEVDELVSAGVVHQTGFSLSD